MEPGCDTTASAIGKQVSASPPSPMKMIIFFHLKLMAGSLVGQKEDGTMGQTPNFTLGHTSIGPKRGYVAFPMHAGPPGLDLMTS